MKRPALTADIWHHIKDIVAPYPVRQLLLTGDHDRLIGLLLLQNGRSSDEILQTLAGGEKGVYPKTGERPASIKISEVVRQLQSLTDEIVRLKNLSQTDPLTGLANVRYFRELLATELDRVSRTRLPCSLLMLDIDHFKSVNDTYGHENGNVALQYVARVLKQELRKIDVAARYGGEEFVVILPTTGLVKAVEVAERLRLAIKKEPPVLKGLPVTITASFGVAMAFALGDMTAEVLIKMADEELYRAKKEGRDRVCHVPLSRPPKSCQVTVEERAQLFGLNSGKQM